MKSIGEKIAELRKRKKLTQAELAAIVGVSAQSVSKWENSQTMPDILLLPTLASALDVTVNDLFSIVSSEEHFESIHQDQTPDSAYRALFTALMRGLSDPEAISREELSKNLHWVSSGMHGGQVGLVAYKDGEICKGTYVNPAIAVSYIRPRAESLALLENKSIAETLTILADTQVRRVMKYMLSNSGATVTAAVAASKCGISAEESEEALNKLNALHLIQIQSVETGEEQPLSVYRLMKEYKVFMAILPLLELARIAGEWHEAWISFRT